MNTELATIETGLSGDKHQIAATVDRIKAMMPIPDDAPSNSVWGLAQVCVALNLNPLAGEAYLAKFNGKYVPIIGTMGYEKKAREQSDFHYDIEELDEMEMKKHRGDLYDSEDYGVRIDLWHYGKASKCKYLGIPYKPTTTYGFWRMKASEEVKWENRKPIPTGKWKPDNIPSSWTKVMVAEKRAVRNAIKRAFSISSFEAGAQAMGAGQGDEFEAKVYDVIEDLGQKEDRRVAPNTSSIDAIPEEDENSMVWMEAPVKPAKKKVEPLADVQSLDDVEEFPLDDDLCNVEEYPEAADAVPSLVPISASQLKQLHAAGQVLYEEWETKRPELVQAITKDRTDSSKKLTEKEANMLISGMNKKIHEVEKPETVEA